MPPKLDRRYWDSNAFLGYLNGEPDKADSCEAVLAAAEDGHVVIVTSALTLAEVLFVKGHVSLGQEMRSKVSQVFRQPYISVQNVTRKIAELGRELYWDKNIRPKDAIHVATALVFNIPVLNTFDEHLLKRDGRIGNPGLRIEKPHEQYQGKLEIED